MSTIPPSGRAGGEPTGPAEHADVLLLIAGVLMAATAVAGVTKVVLVLAVAAQVLFLAYLVRHLAFVVSARAVPQDQALPVIAPSRLPTVSVLVACHDEEAVAEDLCAALLGLDYPADRLDLHLVDDGSSDGTRALLERGLAAHPGARVHSRPAGAPGGKSGALNTALAHATGEIVVVFDADHRPHPDVLRRLVRHFADPSVGAVQGRCVIRGARTLVARLVEVDYLAGYLVNEYGRQAVFGLPAYGGANCAVRADLLRALGGWNTTTVTEDTDLTLRLILTGHRVRYDVTAVDEEEAVTTLRRYWRQRYRWARGHQQVWRDYRGAVWRAAHLTVREKVETTMFLLAFHLPAVAAAGTLLLPLAMALGAPALPGPPLWVLWTLLFLGPLVELGAGAALARSAPRLVLRLLWFPAMFLLGAALCSKAWVDGLLGRPYAWVKTPRAADAPTVPALVGSRA